jgi:predicted nucleic acid-binding protein
MICAVDTNILLDVLLPDPKLGESSLDKLEKAYARGALVICEIVYAELVPQFPDRQSLDRTLEKMEIGVALLTKDSAYLAGRHWHDYRRSSGKRQRIITDFLIGAFAELQAESFLTRDRGFYGKYFKNLRLA